jgi:hypothetical protein
MNQSHHFLELVAHNIALVAVLFLLVTSTAFLVAKKFGGESRAKRKLIFILVGGVGLGLVATYISNKL